MSKSFIGILVAIIIVAIGIVVLANNNASAPDGNAKPTEHIKGSKKSGLKLVEYGDYECPFCAEYYPIVKQANAIYDGLIQFQFRNYPLVNLHKNAFAGARAAEAAALQHKFWQMHDLLYENNQYNQQTGWVVSNNPLDDYFVGYAKQLKLNITQFKKDFKSEKVNNLVNADRNAGGKLGVNATPTFFLNGKQVSPGISLASFEQIINPALKQKGITPPKNATPSPSSSGTNTAPKQTKAQPDKGKSKQ